MRDDRMGRHLRLGATLLLVSALLAPMARADEAAAPLDAAAMAALDIARPVRPDSGPWSWTTGNYAYDASGNITAIGTQSFAYDTRGRLVDATLMRPDQPGSEHETFAYDAFGNLTSRTGASAYSVATPASLATNHLVGATYDGAGNVTLLTPPGQAFQYEYTYDALGSLNQARAANVAGETRQFSIYTADDERIWTYDLGVNTSHWKIRDLGGRVLRDYVVTGDTWQLSRDYIYRGEQLLAAVTPAETLTFSLDHLGTPRVITRADRTLAGYHQYLPYGEEWTNGTGVQEGEPKKFTSHERDRDPSGAGATELDYMHARFYSGRVGRFLSVDPVLDAKRNLRTPQGWNRYTYVLNNPVRHTDPTGRVVSIDGADRSDMLEYMKTLLYNQKAAKYLSMDKSGRLTVTGMSVADWGKQFGGNVAKLASLMQSSYKLNVGFSSDAATQKAGGGLFLPTGRNEAQLTIDRGAFPQVVFGTKQWIDTTLAHEMFGHAMRWAGELKQDTGQIHPGMAILYGIPAGEADGVWAENQWRAQTGDPARDYYFTPGDYIPPGN